MEGLEEAVISTVEMKLSTVLKQLLNDRNMTLKELATSIKVKPSTLSGWNNGVTPRDLTEVRRCAQYFGVTLEKLLFNESSDATALESLLTEQVFDGFLKVKIERVINKKRDK